MHGGWGGQRGGSGRAGTTWSPPFLKAHGWGLQQEVSWFNLKKDFGFMLENLGWFHC